ncbi:MAG TPA: winged helix-turn-helix domain-containing protein [Vitreimonas sp.]|nr:winged helix-turn-helix domain-containing protein [Vitreimonas sp.]
MSAPELRKTNGAPIDLARAADFGLGAMHVRPAALEVEVDGKAERLEPRVMQVLVALAEAEGDVVARGDLLARCWGGAAVGDDAVNRVIQRLRKLSQSDGGRSFTVQTIPRVGYRLKSEAPPPVADPEQQQRPAAPSLIDMARKHWRWLGAAGLGLAVIALFWFATRPVSYALGDIRMAAQSQRWEQDPTLSPDGRFLVYVLNGDTVRLGNTDLFLRDLVSGEEMQLTDTPDMFESAPALSPTGDRLAHVRNSRPREEQAPSPCQIVVRLFPQGVDRQVGACERAAQPLRLSWTPDGRALAYSDRIDGVWRIRLLDLETGEASDLVPAPARGPGDYLATISPDGRRVAFIRYGADYSGDVHVYDLAARRLTRVTRRNTWAQVAWADARNLFVILPAALSESNELWLYSAAGNRRQRLLPGLARLRRPAVAQDTLALGFETQATHLYSFGQAGATELGRGDLPGVSADGVLAFERDGWLFTQAPGAAAQRLAQLSGKAGDSLRWSHDGRRIVYAANQEGRRRLFVIDVASGVVRAVAISTNEELSTPAWSLDGASLLFTGYSARGPRLLRVAVDGGTPEALSDYGWSEPLETAQGLLARSTTRPGVWRVTPGRAPEQVFADPPLPVSAVNGGRWSRHWTVANGRFYAMSAQDGFERWQIVSRAVAGGPVARRDVDRPCDGMLTFDASRGAIVCAITEFDYDIGIARIARSRGLSSARSD